MSQSKPWTPPGDREPTRCKALTKKGDRCGRFRDVGSEDFCFAHDPRNQK